MLEITSIKNGIVIDHIKTGVGVKIFKFLKLENQNNEVALIINAKSNKCGKKDIIKIENATDIDCTALALLSPGITVNEVKDEVIVKKIKPQLPKQVKGLITCTNPRCITKNEKYLEQVFELVNEDNDSYRCKYCDTMVNLGEV